MHRPLDHFGWAAGVVSRNHFALRSSMLNKKLAVGIGAGVIAAAAGIYVAVPASADAAISSVTMSTTTIVLDGDQGCGKRSDVTVKLTQPKDEPLSGYTSATGYVTDQSGDDVDILLLPKKSASGNVTTYADSISLCGWQSPGRYTLRTEATWFDTEGDMHVEKKSMTFYVKRPTTLTYNATPEPVKKGALITHKGRLTFDPFNYGKQYGAANVKLTLAFKRSGTSTYASAVTITTGKDGNFNVKTKADKDGTWRVSLPDNNYRQSQAKTDYIDVK
jgi:hypothetical protein